MEPSHLEIYRARKDVMVVFHTHPPNVIMFSLTNRPLRLLEVERGVDVVPIVRYMEIGTKELAFAISEKIKDKNAVILARHGLVSVGKSVADAYDLTEVIEMNAEIKNRLHSLNLEYTE